MKKIGKRLCLGISLLLAILLLSFKIGIAAELSPATLDIALEPGETFTETKILTTESEWVPAKVDIYFLFDLSGSYGDDLPRMKALLPDVIDSIRASVPDSYFGVGSFEDIPISPWGSAWRGDVGYRRDIALTLDTDAVKAVISGLVIRSGADSPQSQYVALFQSVTGSGLDIDDDGDYDDVGDIAPGLDAGFREGSFRFIILMTDAQFHEPDDTAGYPGPSRDDTVAALAAAGVTVIGIRPTGATWLTDLTDIATATGGSVQESGASSEEIAEAITAGIEAGLKELDITLVPLGDSEGFVTEIVPPEERTIESGESLSWEVTFTGVVECADEPFTFQLAAMDKGTAIIATQDVTITVPPCPKPDLCPDEYRWSIHHTPPYEWDPFPMLFRSWTDVHFVNSGSGDAYNVTATITCAPVNVNIVDGDVTLGDIPAGSGAWSQDFFMLEVDMTNPQDPNKGIVWRLEYDDAAGNHHVIEDIPTFCGEPINCP